MRRRSSYKRRRNSKKKDIPLCKYLSADNVEAVFNSIKWDVAQLPNEASWSNANTPPKDMNSVLETTICAGSISLLLPGMQPGKHNLQPLFVYFMETMKKSNIKIMDVMRKIYHFYNEQKVLPEDLTYMSVSHPYISSKLLQTHYNDPHLIHQIRFINFLGKNTKFSELRIITLTRQSFPVSPCRIDEYSNHHRH